MAVQCSTTGRHLRHLLRRPRCICSSAISPRFLTTGAAADAHEAADQMLRTFEGKTATRRQMIDGNQLQKLCITLGRKHLWPDLDVSTGTAPPRGTPLPPGYHLVYFTPSDLEGALGADGSDRTFNAPAPFTRRMWAGGRMRWFHEARLRVGEEVEERTKLVGATAKKSRDGSEMILVEVEKEFWGERGLSLVDQRSWIFRPEALPAAATTTRHDTRSNQPHAALTHGKSEVRDLRPQSTYSNAAAEGAFPERHLSWSPVALFRFSALTFNAHMIHYNESWTRSVEGHPNVVVHGPLNLITMMDYWRDVHGEGGRLHAKQVAYRALSPIYAGESYKISSSTSSDGGDGSSRNSEHPRHELLVKKGQTICMRGEILGHR
ncbi:hypothetical protein QBC46DRAFT_273667 [Diplogelasinospora grovesii]|uniref:FAS1-like dehydratase domain-containing protein n=1 Tax=Diplogelasinospora grovesii TaxID=303347 RepID=A0AAN6MWA2_9PEZI|nr:hypothetical protein QBC46DRAFT_273667 [Diplogelasinospora grovesii]